MVFSENAIQRMTRCPKDCVRDEETQEVLLNSKTSARNVANFMLILLEETVKTC